MYGHEPSETLLEYELMVDRLLAHSTKAVTARAARVLASYVGHYQLRYGVICELDLAAIHGAPPLSEQIAPRIETLRVLAAALTLAAVVDTPDAES